MADRWSCASTTGVHPRGRLCSICLGGAPVRSGSRGLAWSHCTSWMNRLSHFWSVVEQSVSSSDVMAGRNLAHVHWDRADAADATLESVRPGLSAPLLLP